MAITNVNVLSTSAGATKTKVVTSHGVNQFRVVQVAVATKIFVVHDGQAQDAMVVI